MIPVAKTTCNSCSFKKTINVSLFEDVVLIGHRFKRLHELESPYCNAERLMILTYEKSDQPDRKFYWKLKNLDSISKVPINPLIIWLKS